MFIFLFVDLIGLILFDVFIDGYNVEELKEINIVVVGLFDLVK